MELYQDVTPKTAENFRQLCTGEYKPEPLKKPTGYKGCKFHRIVGHIMRLEHGNPWHGVLIST